MRRFRYRWRSHLWKWYQHRSLHKAYELALSYYFSTTQNRILFYFLLKDLNRQRPTLSLFFRVFLNEHSSSIPRLQNSIKRLSNSSFIQCCDVIWNNDDWHNKWPLDARARPSKGKMTIAAATFSHYNLFIIHKFIDYIAKTTICDYVQVSWCYK